MAYFPGYSYVTVSFHAITKKTIVPKLTKFGTHEDLATPWLGTDFGFSRSDGKVTRLESIGHIAASAELSKLEWHSVERVPTPKQLIPQNC